MSYINQLQLYKDTYRLFTRTNTSLQWIQVYHGNPIPFNAAAYYDFSDVDINNDNIVDNSSGELKYIVPSDGVYSIFMSFYMNTSQSHGSRIHVRSLTLGQPLYVQMGADNFNYGHWEYHAERNLYMTKGEELTFGIDNWVSGHYATLAFSKNFYGKIHVVRIA